MAELSRAIKRLDQLDRESEQLFTQGLLAHAVPIAREYMRLKRRLEAQGVSCPPSVSMWRAR